MGLSYSKDGMIVARVVLTQRRRTERPRAGFTRPIASTALCIASYADADALLKIVSAEGAWHVAPTPVKCSIDDDDGGGGGLLLQMLIQRYDSALSRCLETTRSTNGETA